MERGDLDEAREYFGRCLEMGDAPAIYSPTVGCGSYLAELRLAEVDLREDDLESAVARYAAVRASHRSTSA